MQGKKALTIVIILQGLLLLGQWSSPNGYVSTAQAQIPNPSERQLAMIDELKSVNANLEKLTALLQSGEVQVKVAKTDDK